MGLLGRWGDELGDVPSAAEFVIACGGAVGGDVCACELVQLSQELAASFPGCYVTSIQYDAGVGSEGLSPLLQLLGVVLYVAAVEFCCA